VDKNYWEIDMLSVDHGAIASFSSVFVFAFLIAATPLVSAQQSPVGVTCSFSNVSEYEGRSIGEIQVEVFNLTNVELRNVLVRFAPSINGEIRGNLHRATHLGVGGAHVMSGTFALPAEVLMEEVPLKWEVRYEDAENHVIEITSDLCNF
jgi:hypothetical protein